ncbi:hypothetical protein BJF93_02755 [Xaviernesmea oryzae]|uniref:Uncharacterized protein n=2 Tax=Xaviernesmea oryzae TaxID=464029 RepID=A0A1Q9AZ77_9HYPH|nr:hypothetical protein BJF93_02755 [Xaviernesmea oryzae]
MCMQCQAELGILNFLSLALVDIPESGLIETTCNRGHRTALVIQQSKFEILSEMGVRAIVNGFHRDAVFSFATSLERLYEFFIEAVCRKQGISRDAFSVVWKQMAKQSERQLGAFLTAFLLETRNTPNMLPRKQSEFRNEVVHKGRFPTREEAVQFGIAIFNCARAPLTVLRSPAYAEIIRDLTFERIDERSKHSLNAGLLTSTIGLVTPLSIMTADQPEDLEEIIAAYSSRPDLKRAVEEANALGEAISELINININRNIA